MATHIHKPNGELIVSLNYQLDLFKSNPSLYYPNWKPDMISTEIRYSYPVAENGQLREKTRLELVYEGIEQLNDGEIISENEIIYIPRPEGVKIIWTGSEWIESATAEEIEEYNKKLAVEEYKKQLPDTVFDMDNRLYMTQEMVDTLLFEMMSLQTFAMSFERQEELMTTQAMYYYDRIIQKEKREGLQAAVNYYKLVVSKFPQYKSDIDFLLIENDKEYIITV